MHINSLSTIKRREESGNFCSLPKKTTSEIMDFIRRRIAKKETEEIKDLKPVDLFNLTRLFSLLARMEPDEDLANLLDKAASEIELLEERNKFLIEENSMLYKQHEERDKHGF